MGKIKSSDGKTSLNVKEMLQKGMKPEDLMKQLQDEIDVAQKEIEVESKVSDEGLEEIRRELALTFVEYLTALDVMDEDEIEENVKIAFEVLTNVEKDFRKLENDDDVILRAFMSIL